MKRIALLFLVALNLSLAFAHILNAQGEAPEMNFPETGAPAQAKIDFYESEIKKCKDYVDELSLAINKAEILLLHEMETSHGAPFSGYGWSKEMSEHKDTTRLICNRIRLYQEAIAGISPPASPTPTGSPNPSPSTRSGESSDSAKTRQDKESHDKQVKLIKQYRQEISEIRTAANKTIKEMDDFAKKADINLSGFKTESDSSGGLFRAIFTTPHGRIILQLPADMRAGDTISGTVVAEANGQTDAERAQNVQGLNGYQLKLANKTVTSPWGTFTWNWLKQASKPDVSAGGPSRSMQPELIVLMAPVASEKGLKPVAIAPLTDRATDTTNSVGLPPATKFELPTVGQNGRPTEIRGPFDGDLSNTEIRTGGQPVSILAESTRSCIFKSPEQTFGSTEITLKEGDVETKGTYRNLGLRLAAPKTSLLRGETTELTITVEGLKGIQQSVPLLLQKDGVVNMAGGDTQTVQIRPTDVRADGTFETKRTLTGLVAGRFGVTATVIDPDHRPIIIPLTESARVNGFRVKKDGDKFVIEIEGVQSPITGKPVDGEHKLEHQCPTLSKVPYVNSLFLNKGAGRSTANCLLVMITPRIIVQPE